MKKNKKAGGLPPAFLVQTYPVYEGSVPERSFQEIYIFYAVNFKKTIDNMKILFYNSYIQIA